MWVHTSRRPNELGTFFLIYLPLCPPPFLCSSCDQVLLVCFGRWLDSMAAGELANCRCTPVAWVDLNDCCCCHALGEKKSSRSLESKQFKERLLKRRKENLKREESKNLMAIQKCVYSLVGFAPIAAFSLFYSLRVECRGAMATSWWLSRWWQGRRAGLHFSG